MYITWNSITSASLLLFERVLLLEVYNDLKVLLLEIYYDLKESYSSKCTRTWNSLTFLSVLWLERVLLLEVYYDFKILLLEIYYDLRVSYSSKCTMTRNILTSLKCTMKCEVFDDYAFYSSLGFPFHLMLSAFHSSIILEFSFSSTSAVLTIQIAFFLLTQ